MYTSNNKIKHCLLSCIHESQKPNLINLIKQMTHFQIQVYQPDYMIR